ncbi:MAG TPA: alkaline phosphatase family protein [Chloroflexota bacterium]|nr:alkaline phosphatase family protein [Chloroflexota bacterium]
MDAVRASDGAARAGAKVLVIGLDGVTFDLLGPWIEGGRLPNLARLIREGASGTLTTTVPPISPSAWVSFATGKNPGKHGLVDFVFPKPGSYDVAIVNSSSRTARSLWGLIGSHGRRVGVVGVPVTYPPERVNGFLVTDFLTPSDASDFTHPADLKDELKAAIGGFQLWPDERYRSTPHVDRFVADLEAAVDNRTAAARYLMKTKPWDFFCVVYWTPDMLQHDTWRILDPSHPQHDPIVAARHRDTVIGYFEHLDRRVGELLAEAGEDTQVIVMSDHGFGPTHYFFLVNNWLAKMGLIQFKPTALTSAKRLLFRAGITPLNAFRVARALRLGHLRRRFRFQKNAGITKRLFLSFKDVDWTRTRAYAVGSFGQIYVNLRGVRPSGTVAPGAEYEELRTHIIEEALKLRHPATGEPIVERALRREEVYHGGHVDRMPDVVLITNQHKYMAFGHADFGSNRLVEPVFGLSGHHRPNGIVVLAGPGIQRGTQLDNASIMDLAPTVLNAMGLPIPADMDGTVLSQAFTDQFRASHPVVFDEEGSDRSVEFDAQSPDDETVIRDRLRGFGYVS